MQEKHLKETVTAKDLSLFTVFEAVVNAGYSIGVYKLPHSAFIHVIIDSSAHILTDPIELEQLRGFIFSPFNSSSGYPVVFLEAKSQLIYKIETDSIHHIQTINEDVLEKIITHSVPDPVKWHVNKASAYHETLFDNFEKKVGDVIAAIKRGTVKKVVLSRTKSKSLTNEFSVNEFFINLCAVYPTSFVSLISTPLSGTWIGATPELLASLDMNGVFKTVSLAGTRIKEKDISVSQSSWTEKEIEEQALVSRYIINCFKKIRLREYDEIGPRTVEAGNLLHLKTEYHVNTKEVNFENLTSVMLHLLHPTSAVCGMPKEEALEIIDRLEENNRGYYSGYLGPVNLPFTNNPSETGIDLYVNLRCMQLLKDKAVLYAGAGITEGSVPQSEFLETENKMDTILRVFEV